jgi:hypothetical protein
VLGHSVKIERDDNCFVVIFDQVSNHPTIEAQHLTPIPHHFKPYDSPSISFCVDLTVLYVTI